jgi:hypothetical protein
MVNVQGKGAEEARNHLPKPAEGSVERQASLVPLAGSGRGMWGKDSTRTIRELREEWDR